MKTFKLTFIFCMAFVFTHAQTVHTVDNRAQSGAQFTSLQAAIDAASPGDIIQIHPSSSHYGDADISKQITIVGLGHNPANNNGQVSEVRYLNFRGNSGGSEVKGLRISRINCGNSSNSTNINGVHVINNRFSQYVQGSNTSGMSDDWVIEGNYFASGSTAVYPQTSSNNWKIRNNFVRGSMTRINNTCIITNNLFVNTANSFTFFSYCNSPLVNNNIFILTSNTTSVGTSNSTINFVSNITYNSGGLTMDPLSGSNNLDNTNPLFTNISGGDYTDFYNNDYSLSGSSPGVDAGSDGTDIGLFGNNFPFDIHGRPNVTPYPVSITITNNLVAPGQDLNVEFSAEQKQ